MLWIQSLRYRKRMTWSAGLSQDFEVTSGLVPIRHAQHPTSVSGLDHKSIVAMSQLCTEEWNRLDGAGSAGRRARNIERHAACRCDAFHCMDFTWFYDYLWWLHDNTVYNSCIALKALNKDRCEGTIREHRSGPIREETGDIRRRTDWVLKDYVPWLSSFVDVCWQDLDAKMREKSALSKQMADLKRGKLQCPVPRDLHSDMFWKRDTQVSMYLSHLPKCGWRYDTKLQKKKKEDDSAIVQTMDMDWLDMGHCSVLSLVASSKTAFTCVCRQI